MAVLPITPGTPLLAKEPSLLPLKDAKPPPRPLPKPPLAGPPEIEDPAAAKAGRAPEVAAAKGDAEPKAPPKVEGASLVFSDDLFSPAKAGPEGAGLGLANDESLEPGPAREPKPDEDDAARAPKPEAWNAEGAVCDCSVGDFVPARALNGEAAEAFAKPLVDGIAVGLGAVSVACSDAACSVAVVPVPALSPVFSSTETLVDSVDLTASDLVFLVLGEARSLSVVASSVSDGGVAGLLFEVGGLPCPLVW